MAVLSNTGIRAGASIVTASYSSDPAEDASTVKRSARFNDDDSAYLSQTFATGNRKIWTWSGWVKRSSFGAASQTLMQLFPSGMGYTRLRFVSDQLAFDGQDASAGSGSDVKTNRLFRDPSAWYHICVAMDTTQATDTNRLKMYVNGVQETSFDSPTWPTQNVDYMFNYAHAHNIGRHDGATDYFDGLISNIHFIDGQALDASYFGITNSTTGQWVPGDYIGDYGTNGFHLKMDPANGGTSWSSRAERNPGHTSHPISKAFDGSLSTYTMTANSNGDSTNLVVNLPGLAASKTVKFYGYRNTNAGTLTFNGGAVNLPSGYANRAWVTAANQTNGSSDSFSMNVNAGSGGSDDVGVYAVEVDGKILVDHTAIGYDSSGNKNHWHENNIFGHEATVANDNFKAVPYTGTGSSKTIECGFQPDLVWVKKRNGTTWHYLTDSVRGATKDIYSNVANAESTDANGLSAFTSTGFTVVSETGRNNSGDTFVAWCWKAGGAASANTDGATNSSVSVNNTAGFSIVKWEGQGAATNIGHGLSKAPSLIISKCLGSSQDWNVWHTSLGANNRMFLNTTADAESGGYPTVPTSSIFYVDNTGNFPDGQDVISYCFADVEGHSKFGSYTGNANATGPIIDCGFTPAFVMIKETSTANAWYMYDRIRGTDPGVLWANDDGAEQTSGQNPISLLANGFQITGSLTGTNRSGGTFIYMAFAGSPQGDLDLLADTPGAPYDNSLNGGGNYATLNALDSATTLSNGNLTITGSGSAFKGVRSTLGMKTGKWYFEGKQVALSSATSSGFGIWEDIEHSGDLNSGGGSYGNNYLAIYDYNGNIQYVLGGSATTIEAGSISAGDIFGFALDLDNNTLKVHQNGKYLNSGNSIYDVWPEDRTYFFGGFEYNSGNTLEFNFGQREFAYTPPTGYKSLNAYNLPTPTIVKGNTGFDVKLWTGDGSSQDVSYGFDPDLFWAKRRAAGSDSHHLYDRVRGDDIYLQCDATQAEATDADSCEFGTNKVTIGDNRLNPDTIPFVGWAWDAGAANVTKAAGDLNTTAYLQGEVYSSVLAGYSTAHGSQFQTGAEATKAFDGLIGDAWNEGAAPLGAGTGTYIRFTPSSQVASNTVEVLVNYYNDINFYTGSPGSSTKVAGPFNTSTSGYFTNVDCGTVPAWDYMQIDVSAANQGCYFGGIKIGGKLLVDSNVTPANVPSISTTYRANPNTGFSISTHTSPSSGTTYGVAHGLNVRPEFILLKDRDNSGHWQTWHKDLASGHNFYLNITNASASSATAWPALPTSTTFYTTANGHWGYGVDLVSYSWSSVSGYSKIGSWTSTGNSFVYCGFKPRFLLAKCTSHTGDWMIYDTERGPLNQDADNNTLVANVDKGEDDHYNANQASVDLLSNGFKIRHAVSSPLGDTGRTYIFVAFAESPFKYANAR